MVTEAEFERSGEGEVRADAESLREPVGEEEGTPVAEMLAQPLSDTVMEADPVTESDFVDATLSEAAGELVPPADTLGV